jgi:hypothetical protein
MMTFHLDKRLTTTGKSKRKQKWKSAEHKRQAEQNRLNWEALKAKYPSKSKVRVEALTIPKLEHRSSAKVLESKPATGWDNCTKKASPVYSGTAMIGIATMHKSNSVPVFSKEEAVDISKMRRN